MTSSTLPAIAIVGPTASGKTSLAIALAQRFSGEIVNADSRQIYRYMDIGTAKPTHQEQQEAPHHLLDILNPDQDFSLGSFLSLARAARDDIWSRGRLPIVAGGTGQYVWALLEGWNPAATVPDYTFRRSKEREAQELGAESLHRQLKAIDPERANELDPRNVRRVIRALEIHHITGRKPSEFGSHSNTLGNWLVLGLTMRREDLYQRIDRRVDEMMYGGFLEEVQRLSDLGYSIGKGPLDTLGYRELGQYLAGEITLAEAVQRTKFQTHRLARRQYAWFKPNDPRIHWLDGLDPQLNVKAADLVGKFLSEAGPVVQ